MNRAGEGSEKGRRLGLEPSWVLVGGVCYGIGLGLLA